MRSALLSAEISKELKTSFIQRRKMYKWTKLKNVNYSDYSLLVPKINNICIENPAGHTTLIRIQTHADYWGVRDL